MMYMLDTNIVIYLFKKRPPNVLAKVMSLSPNDKLCISYVTYAELLAGAAGSNNPAKAYAEIAHFIRTTHVLYPNAQVCELYGKHYTDLKQKGTPIGSNDLWIACHALSLGATLVTHNTKEFQRIGDLNWQDWTA